MLVELSGKSEDMDFGRYDLRGNVSFITGRRTLCPYLRACFRKNKGGLEGGVNATFTVI